MSGHPMNEKQVFNWQVVTVLIALVVQFAGVVWVASRVTFQVELLSKSLSSLQIEFQSERSRTTPMNLNIAYIERDIKDIKSDLGEIKKELRKQ